MIEITSHSQVELTLNVFPHSSVHRRDDWGGQMVYKAESTFHCSSVRRIKQILFRSVFQKFKIRARGKIVYG